jgi:hypothetical protein
MNVSLTMKSANVKTGAIPTSVTSNESCPPSCPLNGSGCYAESGPLAIHWKKTTEGSRGMSWGAFCEAIEALPIGQFWRHNVAGDLPSENDDRELISPSMLGSLVAANVGKRGFTYTHKTQREANFAWIKAANEWGFTVNLSANSLEEADSLAARNVAPVVTILPIDSPRKTLTPSGRSVVTCPATYRDDVSCVTCQLCAISSRSVIVGFPAHGTSKKKAEKVFFLKEVKQ